MKKATALILALVILLLAAYSAIAANSVTTRNETEDIFTDVFPDDWFYGDLKTVCDAGLLQGKGNNIFDPDAYVTAAEVGAVAARLHAFFTGEPLNLEKTSTWYDAYFDYCRDNEIFVPEYDDPGDYITREEFCAVVARVLPENVFFDTSTIADGAIADVPLEGQYAQDVYTICRTGILQCNNYRYCFYPALKINRFDLVASLARILVPEQRLSYPKTSLDHLDNLTLSDPEFEFSLIQAASHTAYYINNSHTQGDPARVGALCAYYYCISRPDRFMHSGVTEMSTYGYDIKISIPRKTLFRTIDFLFGEKTAENTGNDVDLFGDVDVKYDAATDGYFLPMYTDWGGEDNISVIDSEIISEGEMPVVNMGIYFIDEKEARWYNYTFEKILDSASGKYFYRLVSVLPDETKPIVADYSYKGK